MSLVPLGLSVEQATEEIVKLEDEIQFHQSQLVLIRWHQGRVVYHMDKSYGTGAVDKLSERTGVHRNTLKLAERLYEYFDGDESQFRAWLESKKRHWYHVEGLLRAGSDPEALGRDAYIERLKRRIERLAMDLDELNTMAEDDEGASGCIFRRKLDGDSDGNWTPIPTETGHGFRRKVDGDSER